MTTEEAFKAHQTFAEVANRRMYILNPKYVVLGIREFYYFRLYARSNGVTDSSLSGEDLIDGLEVVRSMKESIIDVV